MNDNYAILDTPPTPGPITAFGVVTAVSPLKIRMNGATTAVEGFLKLTSYTPVVDDLAVLVQVGPDWVAIGAF
jgi:hypothetical protein